jgi:hypothetical protein
MTTHLAGRVRAVLVVGLALTLTPGCMGVVSKRAPRMPRGDRDIPGDRPPAIALVFKCESTDAAGEPTCCECAKLQESFDKVAGEFAFLGNASPGVEPYEYSLVVRTRHIRRSKVAPVTSEECFYIMMALMPCIDLERIETSAEIRTPDGTLVARSESAASRTIFSHAVMLFAFPVALVAMPAALRFSTNTYRNLLPPIGRGLEGRPGPATIGGDGPDQGRSGAGGSGPGPGSPSGGGPGGGPGS